MVLYGKIEDYMKAIILSANDVIADILYIIEDEPGIAPLGMGRIDLPPITKIDRERDPLKEPRYKRGDVITIRVNVQKQNYTYKDILDDLFLTLCEIDEDNTKIYEKLEEHNKRFNKEWAEMCIKERQ